MRLPQNLPTEFLLVVALGVCVVTVIFALQTPPGDRTRFTVEHTEKTRLISERAAPLAAEETALGR